MRVAIGSFAHPRAAHYAELLRDRPGIEVVAADPGAPAQDPDRGAALAGRLGVAYADGLDDLFDRRPQAVVVTAPVGERRDLVERAARAGAHVLCETPLAPTEADAQAMIEACRDAGVELAAAFPVRFNPAFAALRTAVADGSLGSLVGVSGTSTGPGLGGGALADHAGEFVDLVDALLDGEPAAQVYAQGDGRPARSADTGSAALLTIRYLGDTVASVDCVRTHAGDRTAPAELTLTCVGDRASVEFQAHPRLFGGFDEAAGLGRADVFAGTDTQAALLDAFLGAVREGRRPYPDGAAGLRSLQIVEAARQSLSTGQIVALRDPAVRSAD